MAQQMNGFILGFVMVLVGVVLVTVVADEVTRVNQINTVNNETIALTNQTTTSLANSQLSSFTSLVNSSNTSQTYAVDTDYTVDLSGGSVTSLGPSGDALATYNYREVGDSVARTLVNLILIFFALGVMAVGVGLAVKSLREAGVL